MHFPGRQMSDLQSAVQEMNRFLAHSVSASVSSTFNSYKKQSTRIGFRFSFVTRNARTPAYDCIPHACESLLFHFYTRKNRTWHLRLFAVVIVPFFKEDITGSTDLNTVPCYEEVTKVHSNRGYNCVRTWWFTTACLTCDCLFAPSWG